MECHNIYIYTCDRKNDARIRIMSEYVPDRMSVDGDHSKKVICKFLVSDMWVKPTRHPCEQIWQIPPRFLEIFGVAWNLSLFGIA